MFTLTSTTLPSVASMTDSIIGPSVLHGPHHGAHRSTTTVTSLDFSITSDSNVASVTSMAAIRPGYRADIRAASAQATQVVVPRRSPSRGHGRYPRLQ